MPQKNYLVKVVIYEWNIFKAIISWIFQGAIETLNRYQTAKAGHASLQPKYNKLEAMTKYLSRYADYFP